MAGTIARELKQQKPFSSAEEEVLVGLQIATSRVMEPWTNFLKSTAELTLSQYNVLRILRGSHPTRLTCGDIVERMIARDPDVTRLLDRLERSGLVSRVRSRSDRRVVEVGITPKGLDLLKTLDPAVDRMPRVMLGHLGPARLRVLARLLEAVLKRLGNFP
jgi:DNA-binding MarR family transcriptional regulator